MPSEPEPYEPPAIVERTVIGPPLVGGAVPGGSLLPQRSAVFRHSSRAATPDEDS